MTGARVVVVDHHDSYTWNLVHLVAAVTGVLPAVVEHDEVGLDDLAGYSHVVLSPGPGNPAEPGDFAVGRDVLLSAAVPVLGVCLGMQGLVSVYGGRPARRTRGDGLVHRRAGPRRDGGRAPREALVGRAVPPRVGAHRARRTAGPQLPGGRVSVIDPVARFRDLAARHERMFWLDGGGARAWSGRRSILGFLRDEDVSLTFDAAARRVERHQHGRAEVVGDDVFTVLTDEVARDGGDPAVSWVGYLGYACRTDLPAHTGSGVPDAVWMRVRDPLFVEHPDPGPAAAGGLPRPGTRATPAGYARAFDEVQRQLRLGNSY